MEAVGPDCTISSLPVRGLKRCRLRNQLQHTHTTTTTGHALETSFASYFYSSTIWELFYNSLINSMHMEEEAKECLIGIL
jgi:hypothetical protein